MLRPTFFQTARVYPLKITCILSLCGTMAALLFLLAAPGSLADSQYPLTYQVKLLPGEKAAQVKMILAKNHPFLALDFNIDGEYQQDFKADKTSTLEITGERVVWRPTRSTSWLSYRVKIDHQRQPGAYDAMITADWLLMRGDDLVPPAVAKISKSRKKKLQRDAALLDFELPGGWTSINTGWERVEDDSLKAGEYAPRFIIDNPDKSFDRPTGWIIAGKLGTRRDEVGSTRISVSAPAGSTFRRLDVLTFLNFVWPQIETAFVQVPRELLIVGADDPFWRGGLSAANSFFLHADRPLVSENATSTLVHELFHMVTRIRGARYADWIAEGLAEFYSFELLYRAGGITAARRERVLDWLSEWSSEVDTLHRKKSTGPTTARAAVLFAALDREIRELTNNDRTIDDISRALMQQRKVDLQDLQDAFTDLTGKHSSTLKSPLLQPQ